MFLVMGYVRLISFGEQHFVILSLITLYHHYSNAIHPNSMVPKVMAPTPCYKVKEDLHIRLLVFYMWYVCVMHIWVCV